MLAIEECLRKRTALKPLEEALIIGVDARAHPGLLPAACSRLSTPLSAKYLDRSCRSYPLLRTVRECPIICAAGVHPKCGGARAHLHALCRQQDRVQAERRPCNARSVQARTAAAARGCARRR